MTSRVERNIEVVSWIATALLLIRFVPRNKIREALVAFKFKQIITWLFGLVVVELGLIKYPKRLFFKHTTKSSFTFEFFIYPAICAIFNINYPEKSKGVWKFCYYLFFAGTITVFEVIAVRYTRLIRYPHWRWYWSFITMWITFYMSRIYYRWFNKSTKQLNI